MTHSRCSVFGLILMLLAVSAGTQWWAGLSQARLGDKMAALVQPGDIQMLSSKTCAYYTVARQWMQQHGVVFGECFIETDKACAAQFEAARAAGTPVVLVRGQPQVGFDA
jgi:hypothetical protein